MKEFDVILADPPWAYEVWDKDTGQGKSAEAHYSTMSIEDICALPIKNMASKNCALFMWVTFPFLEQSFEVINAWGFTYRTQGFTWIKAKKSGFGFFTGMGYYSRANAEICLLSVKGSMPVSNRDVLSVIYSPIRAHSQKPDEQYGKIERLYPDRKYLELFARRKNRPQWSYWGNEVDSDINMDDYYG